MRFHREGYPSLILALVFGACMVFIANYFFPEFLIAKLFAWTISLFFLIVILQFFRDPVRNMNKSLNAVIAPADGKVVVIEETNEAEYFGDKRLQVSIFMSPINVHINRYPIEGKVKYFKYHPGKFMAAWEPKSSTENERTTVVVEGKGKEVLFRQVAGALARRIVWYCKEGDEAKVCNEMGFIKFGSRVDLYFPLGTQLKVKIGDVVKGGISEIAEW